VTTVTEELIRAATNIPGFIFNSTDSLGNSGSSNAIGNSGVVGGQGISNFAVGRGNSDRGFGGLVLSASSRNVSVLLRALSESRHVQILSRPQVRTLDNQPAFIQVGQRVPRIVGSTVNQNGQSNSVTLENVGLILGVTPRVSPDNTVVMEIDAERSKLGEEIDGVPVAVSIDGTVIRSPRIDTITAQATVSAANGETIILGGLISEDRRGVHRRVPIIQDIPVLKHLFKFDSEETRRAELLVILTPHVIRSIEDSERLKQVEIARMHWCERDVYRIHGDINVASVAYENHFDAANPPVVYPDLNPSGEMEPVIVDSLDAVPEYTATPPAGVKAVDQAPIFQFNAPQDEPEETQPQ
jgi:type II secretory pathway component GspD/PulD (secretin)